MSRTILTVGYGNQEFALFAERLRAWKVLTLADVRSQPYSKYWECYRRAELEALCEESGFRYIYCGDTLGGMPADRELWTDGGPDYEKMTKRPEFDAALVELEASERVALICGCVSPLECHRGKWLTPELERRGWQVRHGLMDGSVANSLDEVRLVLSGGQQKLFDD